MFELHQNLCSKIFIADLPLCKVLMEDEKNYPWFFLVPRLPNISKLIDLALDQQLQVMKELSLLQQIVWNYFSPTQLNVAAIGNKTPQLHIHVIGRYTNDPAWPATVWDHPTRSKYDEEGKEKIIEEIRQLLI